MTQDVKYHLSMKIEVSGSDHVFTESCEASGGFQDEAFAAFFATAVGQDSGWIYKQSGKKLVIEGWKDPKTGTLHKVKNITMTSKDLPKECMPKVTGVPRKA